MADAWTKIAMGFALLAGPAAAAQTAPAPKPPGYTMPATEMWEIAAGGGGTYRIFVSIPEVPPPDEGFPVLYVLDGNAMFASFAETRRIQEFYDVGKMIVVGVGYPTDKAYDTRRLYDFTAAIPTPTPPEQRKLAHLPSGGRDKFLDFVTGKLRSEVGRRYKINLERQALFGHSLGGLFALHALYTRPEAFHAIIAASPSLWWNEQAMLAEERDFGERLKAGRIKRPARLMVVAGDREESIINSWDAEAFGKRIRQLSGYGLRTRFELYEGEGHMTVPVRAVPGTLRFAMSWP